MKTTTFMKPVTQQQIALSKSKCALVLNVLNQHCVLVYTVSIWFRETYVRNIAFL